MATNTNVVAEELLPQAGSNLKGWKVGFIDSVAKAAQNDTFTVTNATTVIHVIMNTDADGVSDPCTLSTNVVTMTSATATPPSGIVIFR